MKVTRETFDEVMMPCYVPQDMVLTHGEGCFLYDSEGNEYLDMTAGIAVNCLGHNHPQVVKTINKQAKKLLHASNVFVNDKTLKLAKKLTELTGYDRVFFVNSGAEANEAALKLARRVAYDNVGESKDEIISFTHSFHGRTFFSVSVGGQEKYYQGFGPIPGGITHLPFNDVEAFKKTISDKTCAVILEVVQGEGGILEVDPVFLKTVRELCTKHNALLIFDEVQTGVGRLGTFYGYEQFGVKPDILTSAKGLAAGVPIGAILTYDHIAKHFKPGTHGSTFGGNPLACAVGSMVVDIVSDQTFLDKVRSHGEYLRKQLRKLNKKYEIFADVRGVGLLVGAQLASPYDKDISTFQKLCTKHKLLVLQAGYDVVRFAPPLIITKKEIRKAIKLLESVITDFLSTHKLNELTKAAVPAPKENHDANKAPANQKPEPSSSQAQAKALCKDPEPVTSKDSADRQDEVLEDEEAMALTQEVISSFDSLESLATALLPEQEDTKSQEPKESPAKQSSKGSLSEQAMQDYMEQLLGIDDDTEVNTEQSSVTLKGNEPSAKDETAPSKKSSSPKAKKPKAKRK